MSKDNNAFFEELDQLNDKNTIETQLLKFIESPLNNPDENFKAKEKLVNHYFQNSQFKKAYPLLIEMKNALLDGIEIGIERYADFCYRMYYCYFYNSELQKSRQILDRYRSVYDKLPKSKKADYYFCVGQLSERLKESTNAIKALKKSLNINIEINDFIGQVTCLYTIANLYYNIQQPQKAITYLEESQCIFKNQKFKGSLRTELLVSLLKTKCLYGLHDFSNAAVSYKQTYKLALNIEGDQVQEFLNKLRFEKIQIYIEQNLYDKVIDKGEKLLTHSSFATDINYVSLLHHVLAMAYFKTEQFTFALHHSEIAVDYFEKNQFKEMLKQVYHLHYQILKGKKLFEKSLAAHEKYALIVKEIVKSNEENALERFSVRYESEQKEKEAQIAKAKALQFQLQSLRSQMNPHFVFNAINSINSTLKTETIEDSKQLLRSFARLMRSNLDFAERPKISLEEEIAFLHDYLALEQNRLGNKLSFDIHYPEDLDLDFIELPSMLIQPYIENSIKHGILPLIDRKGKIDIYFEELEEDTLVCKIQDNGVGRAAAAIRKENTEKHLGKSTKITENRLKLLTESKGKETVFVNYDDANTGTTATLQINL